MRNVRNVNGQAMLELENYLFNIDIPTKEPYSGALLISEPFMKETYFSHSVICLIEYSKEDQAMGIVMNKSTGYVLQDLLSNIKRKDDIPVYCGGPLSCDRLYFIHSLGDIIPGSRHICDGIYIGGEFRHLINYVNSGYPVEGVVRFYLGYSGWDIGQLKDEIKNNVWAVGSISDTETLLTGSDDTYWHNHVKMLGKKYRCWRYYPQNPSVN